MTYPETLEYLYSQMPEYQRIGQKAYKEGLDNSLTLDRIFNHPHQRFKSIHVGGTNGKGSVSHLLAAILQEAGYRVGLYTSPHLIDFRERIKVNGRMVPEEYVVEFVDRYRALFEPVMPSFFELTMAMAFLYFAEQAVEVAVVEVGLGGRLDSTNIISPDLSVITNIGRDHVKILGNSLTEIAAEKAGIIKPRTPVVIGEAGDGDVERVFTERANSLNAPLHFAERKRADFTAERNHFGWLFHADGYPPFISQLNGWAQDNNARTVLTAVDLLLEKGYNIPREAVLIGFARVVNTTGLMGRWQTISSTPRTICDIAHNAHGIRYVAEQLRSEPYERLHIVFGMANDKEVDEVLSLLPKEATYYFTRAAIDRALNEKELAAMADAHGLRGLTYPTVPDAVNAARKTADKERDLLFIGGSAFIVAEALSL
ncbi:MAG: folylpolyglutamate synthase/dihydrofolate synthase family protein [Bacteroidota bacterium]|nr:folylpolyglutamate synthase/dihydrofolate synthase family protein [Bacteroidota bacterium]